MISRHEDSQALTVMHERDGCGVRGARRNAPRQTVTHDAPPHRSVTGCLHRYAAPLRLPPLAPLRTCRSCTSHPASPLAALIACLTTGRMLVAISAAQSALYVVLVTDAAHDAAAADSTDDDSPFTRESLPHTYHQALATASPIVATKCKLLRCQCSGGTAV